MSNILPFYLVCDESGSMDGDPLRAMNEALPELHKEIGSNPVVCDKTRFSIITFNDRAKVLQPLEDLSQITRLPQLEADGTTDYANVFRLLRSEIESDAQALKAEGHRVFRPSVFFLSDGRPNDNDWETALASLTDPAWKLHPNILAFGIGAADPGIIRKVGITKAFMADGSKLPAQALSEFATMLTRSIINSGSAGNLPAPIVPDKVPGFTMLPADEV